MPDYRLYLLDDRQRLHDYRTFSCDSDVAAVTAAAELGQDYHAVELWAGSRIVGQLTAAELEIFR